VVHLPGLPLRLLHEHAQPSLPLRLRLIHGAELALLVEADVLLGLLVLVSHVRTHSVVLETVVPGGPGHKTRLFQYLSTGVILVEARDLNERPVLDDGEEPVLAAVPEPEGSLVLVALGLCPLPAPRPRAVGHR